MTATTTGERAVRHRSKWLKVVAYALFIAGFLIPFAASGFDGTALFAHPWLLLVHLALWAVGVALEWKAYVIEGAHGPGKASGGRAVLEFIGRGSSTWLLLGIMFGFVYFPTVSTSYVGTDFNVILAVTLAVMGIQISLDAWRDLVRDVRPVLAAVLLRWILMPLLGYSISYVFFHPFLEEDIARQLATGMILLATSPTGAASNSLTYISKGDLALSVSATTLNVIIAPFLQPVLVNFMTDGHTAVDAGGMFLELVKFVLVPVVAASLVGIIAPKLVERLKPFLPTVAVLTLAFVLMGTVSKGTATILANPGVMGYVVAACVVYGCIGLSLGYFLPKFVGFGHPQRVAASFEVGVENAAVAPALAISYFSPLAIVPAVVYGKTQNLLAVTIFAPYYQRKADRLAAEGEAAVPRSAEAAHS
jgi:BASS family bile acid:Na+ symporter